MPTSTALRLEGRDALPLLHRISSNALDDLAAGAARGTLFCDYRGRLLHRAVVARTSDGAVWLLRDDAPGGELAAFLERFVFRDEVRMADHSASLGVTRALATRDEQGVEERDGAPARVASGDGTVYAIAPGPLVRDESVWERARIGALVPRHGHEISDAFTPYEVGLAHEVHLAKGCYTGQEALQRLVTHDSVRRQLALVRLAGPAPALPADVLVEGARAGALTSLAAGEGLAVLRRDALARGAAFALADGRPLAVARVAEPSAPLGRA